ncbi:MAG: hypothetical protein COS57_05170 [Syntrophobacterales bacterium CG03_land_8_20_14_0_80_58_14]|nr:MAG: hypothetical protein COS57_05170 [Syntrophobacterales bacterium CG03_land_8_20_14_0_80_58_14]
MPEVPESRLKGNYGAAVVMARLSAKCLVRPVAADTDVGVDLYCETVDQKEQQPHLHFWVQVKAGNQCKKDPSSESARCSFKRSELEYWARQPVPVFAALVPTEWPPQSDPDIYIVDITTWSLFEDFSARKEPTLHSNYHWPAKNTESVKTFLTKVVPESTARLQISKGVIEASPVLTRQYVRSIPAVPVSRFKDKILNQIRTTATNSILFSYGQVDEQKDDIAFLHRLARIVAFFNEDHHWETYMARAISSHADQDYDGALALYNGAVDSIKGDSDVCDQPEFQEQLKDIEHLENCVRNKQPPSRRSDKKLINESRNRIQFGTCSNASITEG